VSSTERTGAWGIECETRFVAGGFMGLIGCDFFPSFVCNRFVVFTGSSRVMDEEGSLLTDNCRIWSVRGRLSGGDTCMVEVSLV